MIADGQRGCYVDDLKRITHKKKKQPILKMEENNSNKNVHYKTHKVNICSTELVLVFKKNKKPLL